jgi:dihydroorotase
VIALAGTPSVCPWVRQVGLLLLVHGEVVDPAVDFFDREKVFIERVLRPLLAAVPQLRVVLEHITTREAAEFVMAAPPTVAASVTPQHILLNRNALFQVRRAPRDPGPLLSASHDGPMLLGIVWINRNINRPRAALNPKT